MNSRRLLERQGRAKGRSCTRVHLRTRSYARLAADTAGLLLPPAVPAPPPDLRSGALSVSFLKKKLLKKWQRSRTCCGSCAST